MTRMKRLVLVAIAALGIPFMASGLDRMIGYSGFLTNNLGNAPITDGTYSLIFSIYTVSSGGTAVWTDTFSVTTVTGEFSVMLGSGVSLSALDFSSDTNYWLGIRLSTNPSEFTPRKEFLYVPYTFRFEKVETRATDPSSPVTGQMWLIVP